MQEHFYELSVGDVVHIGEFVVTVIDIDGSDVSFRIDPGDSEDFAVSNPHPQQTIPHRMVK